jgi:hypothetical protein
MKSVSLFTAAIAVGSAIAYPNDLGHPEFLKLGKRQGGLSAIMNSVVNRKFCLLNLVKARFIDPFFQLRAERLRIPQVQHQSGLSLRHERSYREQRRLKSGMLELMKYDATGLGMLKGYRYGPYKVPNMKVINMLGEEGALWNYADTSAPKPCEDCTIVGMNAGLEYADGTNANIDTGLWLHHVSPETLSPDPSRIVAYPSRWSSSILVLAAGTQRAETFPHRCPT